MNLLRACVLVGGIGAGISIPLIFALGLGTMGLGGHALFFFLGSPIAIFVFAAATFALVNAVLPSFQRRARYAGAIAGVLTFLIYEVGYASVLNYNTGFRAYPFTLFPYLASVIVIGWIPILGGMFAGAKAERFLGGASS